MSAAKVYEPFRPEAKPIRINGRHHLRGMSRVVSCTGTRRLTLCPLARVMTKPKTPDTNPRPGCVVAVSG